ncbi:5-formyltetrahydrofolate cyclo-ligase [Limnospira fusiformis PMC 851.14]|uniref:5-formyltetrahydrofolate cyclo-ligase n=1 Tax=Limnospira fusiformis PMC 851.14 TaxID=2219512 RepID=A0ABU9EJJ0_LIMFS
MSKSQLRRRLLSDRQSLATTVWRQNSDRITDHLRRWWRFQQAKTILAYFSFRQEPDLSPLWYVSPEKVWGFPRCVDGSLIWHHWRPENARQRGSFGLMEPDPSLPVLQPSQVDLILVPSVSCDGCGYRLGYGGGFYDRMLSRSEWSKIPTVGIVFAAARVDTLPRDSWDQPLAAVCTEEGIWEFSK